MKRIVLLIFLFSTTVAQAAGPVAHAYLSRRLFIYFPSRFTPEQQNEFIIGTLFPDIRYMGDIKRHQTHYETMTLAEVLGEPSPFLAGVKFHSYVDLVRERYIQEHRPAVHQAELDTPHFTTYLKLLEDEVLFDVGDWHSFTLSLQNLHPEEEKWDIPSSEIRKWHSLMTLCMQYHPSKVLLLLTISHSGVFGAPQELLNEWRRLIPEAAKRKEVQNHVEHMVAHFEGQMQKFKTGRS